MAVLLPVPFQYFPNPVTGLPLAFGKMFTYAAGTNTQKAAFSDQAGTVPLTNPINFDAEGFPLSAVGGVRVNIWVDGVYKYVLQDANGVQVGIPTDNVSSFVAGGANTIDINGLTENTAPAIDDYIPTYDTSATANRKVSVANLLNMVGTPPVRQTVLQSPIDTAGLPTFLPATSVNLNLTSQNISSGIGSLIVTASQGFTYSSSAGVNRTGQTATNLTWTGLTASTTNFLYVDVAADGTLTTGFTVTAPIYQQGGTPAVTAGTHTFNIGQMTMFAGNGSSAVAVYRVFVGEAITSGTAVTSTIAYGLMGRYDSGYTATLPAAASLTTKNHNLGFTPEVVQWKGLCTTTDGDFTSGDTIDLYPYSAPGTGPANKPVTRNAARFRAGSSGAGWGAITSGGSTNTGTAAMTAASWSWKVVCNRNWGGA